MKFIVSFSILLFACIISRAQNNSIHSIKGFITDSSGNPASFVTIELKHASLKTAADEHGYFFFSNVAVTNDTLIVKGIGFKNLILAFTLPTTGILDLGTIIIKHEAYMLQGVEIIGTISNSYKSNINYTGTKIPENRNNIPQSISVITNELIKDKMSFQLKDAVTNAAGITSYSGFEEYTIRGLRAENPHLVNGLRTYNTMLTSPLLVNIDRVEVINGPVSVLYGNADPGGTINLITKKPLQQSHYAIDLYTGSWNNFRACADATGAMNKNKNLLYRFNTGYEHTKSFRNQYYAKSFTAAPSVSFIPNDKLQLNLDITFTNNHTIADRGQPGLENNFTLNATPINLNITQPGDYLKETNLASILSLSYKINDHITFNSAYLNYNTWQNLSEHGFQDYITSDSVYLYYHNREFNTVTNTLTNYLNFNFKTGNISHKAIAGFDFVKSTVSPEQWVGENEDEFGDGSGIVGTFSLLHPLYLQRNINEYDHEDNDEDAGDDDAEQYKTTGIYIQDELTIKKLKLLFSLRNELYKGIGDDTTKENVLLPRIGIVYAAAKNLNLFATYNKGFDPFEPAAVTQVFNTAFKPVYSNLIETGIKTDLLKEKLSATFSLYRIILKNVAVNANDPENPDLFIQRGEEQSTGAEAEFTGNLFQNLETYISFAYNNSIIKKSEKPGEVGTLKENAPHFISNAFIKYSVHKGFLKNAGFNTGYALVTKRNTLDKSLTLPAYCVINAGLFYNIQHFSVACNVENITNKIYYTSAYNNVNKWPGKPRNFLIRVSYMF